MSKEIENTFVKIEEIANYLIIHCKGYKKMNWFHDDIKDSVSDKMLNRYLGLTQCLKYPYVNYSSKHNQFSNEGFLIQYWSTLGSHLETTMQIFLSIHFTSFEKSNFNIWKEEDIKILREQVNILNTNLMGLNLSPKVRKSFIKGIKSVIKEKESSDLSKMMLALLIDFFESEGVVYSDFNKKDIDKIREFRNAIHSYRDRNIGNWDEAESLNKKYIELLLSLSSQLPPYPEELPYPVELDLLLKKIY